MFKQYRSNYHRYTHTNTFGLQLVMYTDIQHVQCLYKRLVLRSVKHHTKEPPADADGPKGCFH